MHRSEAFPASVPRRGPPRIGGHHRQPGFDEGTGVADRRTRRLQHQRSDPRDPSSHRRLARDLYARLLLDRRAQDGKFREIRVKVDRPHVDVRYRKGYFALKPPDDTAKARKDDIRGAVWSPLESTALAVNARAGSGRSTGAEHHQPVRPGQSSRHRFQEGRRSLEGRNRHRLRSERRAWPPARRRRHGQPLAGTHRRDVRESRQGWIHSPAPHSTPARRHQHANRRARRRHRIGRVGDDSVQPDRRRSSPQKPPNCWRLPRRPAIVSPDRDRVEPTAAPHLR